mmetsp:Transcript_13260/g.24023  ORF Transcript_13260/g.24023 Transcript_13260/m.24023 type:complete len:130 (-) Transcript_13260:190-579(-)
MEMPSPVPTAQHGMEMQPCSTHFMAMDAVCDDRDSMDTCFESCIIERGVDSGEMPQCQGLTNALCACGKKCTSSDACKIATIATINCNLENEFNCWDHTCSKSSFSLGGKGLFSMKTVGDRIGKIKVDK